MAEMRWNLEQWLETHEVTKYELAQSMGGNVKTRLTSLYRMREPKRVDLAVMGEIVAALIKITGETVTPNDLLEYVPTPAPAEADPQAGLIATDVDGLNAALADLEADLSPAEVDSWREAFVRERATE